MRMAWSVSWTHPIAMFNRSLEITSDKNLSKTTNNTRCSLSHDHSSVFNASNLQFTWCISIDTLVRRYFSRETKLNNSSRRTPLMRTYIQSCTGHNQKQRSLLRKFHLTQSTDIFTVWEQLQQRICHCRYSNVQYSQPPGNFQNGTRTHACLSYIRHRRGNSTLYASRRWPNKPLAISESNLITITWYMSHVWHLSHSKSRAY